MKILLCYIFKTICKCCYAILKVFPTDRKKILFLSRQSNSVSIDARWLIGEIRKRYPGVKVKCIARRLEPSMKSVLSFGVAQLVSMYHLATSRVCILESYWPTVSILKHKSTLIVVQMWHSIGKIKKSSKQALGKPGGKSRHIASVMKMHEGYDMVIAGGRYWNPYYCEAFGVSESKIRNVGLPRIDYLLAMRESIRCDVRIKYPQIIGKKVVLYAPTFRQGYELDVKGLVLAMLAKGVAVIVKSHPNQIINVGDCAVVQASDFSALQLLSVADYLVTDYSAIALEAAAVDVKTLYFVPDYERYQRENGTNIDLKYEVPHCVFNDPNLLAEALCADYPIREFEHYKRKFLFENLGHSSAGIIEAINNEVSNRAGLR